MVTIDVASLMVKVRGFDRPPPGFGLNTLTSPVPVNSMKVEGIGVCSWVLLTNVVDWFCPSQRTTEDETKLLPLTVKVKPGSPAAALLGTSKSSEGTEFAVSIMKDTAEEEAVLPKGS